MSQAATLPPSPAARPAGSLRVETLSTDSFAGLQNRWNALLSSSAADNYFLRWEWLDAWRKNFPEDREFQFSAVWDGAELVGLAPFYISRGGPLMGRRLGLASARDLSPDYMDVIARQGMEDPVAEALAAHLSGMPGWDTLEFNHTLPESLARRVAEKAAAGGQWLDVRDVDVCPFFTLSGADFDDFLKKHFPSKRRHDLQRKMRNAFDRGGLVLERVSAPEALGPALDVLFDLHVRRAGDKKIRSVFAEQKSFHQDLASRALAQGHLRLYILRQGAAAVSATYGFAYRNKYYFYQSGLDPAAGALSPGIVVLTCAVRDALAEGLAEFDLLKGTEGYKRFWATERRVECDVRVYRRSFKGWARFMSRRLKGRLRGLLTGSTWGFALAEKFFEGAAK